MNVKKMVLVGLAATSLLAFRDAGAGSRTSHKRFFHRQLNGEVSVVILKESYELKVYDQDGWYATYPVVFGSKSLGDKMYEGDRKTPEGVYHIESKRLHEPYRAGTRHPSVRVARKVEVRGDSVRQLRSRLTGEPQEAR